MRTTLDVDDDVLAAAKEVSRLKGESLGKTISDLARRGLEPQSKLKVIMKNGVPVIQHQRKPIPVTPELVRAIAEME